MAIPVISLSSEKLVKLGLQVSSTIHYQLSAGELMQDALRTGEGICSDSGALVVSTGEFTGRSPKDKFIVKDQVTANTIDWNDINIPLDEKYFHIIHQKITGYLNDCAELWVRDCFVCADPRYRINVRVVNDKPWSNLFACNMFLRPEAEDLEDFIAEWHILSAPGLKLDPEECGTRQHNATVISFRHKTVLIAGTGYTGEMKKGMFTILNYLLPHEHDVLSMHCSANSGQGGDTAIFFGLSGTGKTTLSSDPSRSLIGDDEHGWSDEGIFNFEGGCYAKTIGLSEEKEPDIFNAIRSGALVENVTFFPGTTRINFADGFVTENSRVSYPLHFINNAAEPSIGNTPRNIFFLTCDASGVLPPISKLTPGQAMYQFISGYTAKVAGTETGITEPKLVFSACFGAPFLPLHPGMYAEMLGRKMKEHDVKIWMVNTGWTGGQLGTGTRIKLSLTRAMIAAALEGKLDSAAFETHPPFGFAIPLSCPGVPSALLNPKNTWEDQNAYDETARKLASLYRKNFEKYAAGVGGEILSAAPGV